MSNEEFVEEGINPKQGLNIEGLLLMEMNRMSVYRENSKQHFCSSIEGLIEDCPKKIRTKGFQKLKELGLTRCNYSAITEEKMILYADLKIYVLELLEKNRYIYKERKVRTFD